MQRGEGGPGNTASLPDDLTPADFTVEQAVDLLKAKAEGPRALGPDPATGKTVYVMNGRFGAYVQLGETPERPEKPEKTKAEKGKAKGEKVKAEVVANPRTHEVYLGS